MSAKGNQATSKELGITDELAHQATCASDKPDEAMDSELPDNQPATFPSRAEELDDRMNAAKSLLQLSEPLLIDQGVQTDDIITTDQSTQSVDDIDVEYLKKQNEALSRRAFGVNTIQGDDAATKFFTGLPCWGMFLHLYMFLVPFITPSKSIGLDDEFFAVLARLRLNLMLKDLAMRFDVSLGTMSNIFQMWLDVMFIRLKFLIVWPSQEILENNMPLAFQQLYPNCRVIIDCSEIFIEMPSSFEARSKTFSNYKKHNTVKFLIGITPCGTVSFLSKCWGGRVSDKAITQDSHFLRMLEPGDIVLADRGFTVSEDIALHGGKLKIPAFSRGKEQLSQKDTEKSKELSRVRIHVERVIGQIKNRYTILKGTLCISMIKHKGDEGVANIDKLLLVCCALTNLGEPVIKGCL